MWSVPTSLEIGGVFWKIRTDYRAILDILMAINSTEYEDDEKFYIFMDILFEDFEHMPQELWEEAYKAGVKFIDMNEEDDSVKRPKLMDWEQDATLIVPAVNKVIGKEVRAVEYMHWWTFMSAYMEIGESSFATVLSIRKKKKEGKKLEKWEQEFYRENKSVIDLKRKLSEEEREEKQRLIDKFG